MKKDFIGLLKAQGYSPVTLLDVGAHVGTFASEFTAAFPGCVATLVEPNPHCAEALAKTGFETHIVAASDVNGTGELFLTKEWLQSTGSSLYRENTAFFRDDVVIKQPITKARIDDLFGGRQFDFVKIDTQGSELDVLRGGAGVLRRARYILIEISLVNYNQGGAGAEDVFAELDRLGFHCTEVTEFHRLRGVKNGDLLQIDVLFEPRRVTLGGQISGSELQPGIDDVARLEEIAREFAQSGRTSDAMLVLEQLSRFQDSSVSALRELVRLQGGEGRHLDAMKNLLKLKQLTPDAADVLVDIQAALPGAIGKFNDAANAGDVAGAEAYASLFAQLVPGNDALVGAAMSCAIALGKFEDAAALAKALLRLNPSHPAATAFLSGRSDIEQRNGLAKRIQAVLAPQNGQHALVRLRDLHDLAGEIMCSTLDAERIEAVSTLLETASRLEVDVAPGTEFAGWLKHYRLAIKALDLPMALGPTPDITDVEPVAFASSVGARLMAKEVRAHADRLGAKVAFFAAADANYVDLYARWYIKSILKHCDVPCLVVVHVIGGKKDLKAIAKSLGIQDERLVLCGDDFDPASVTTRCYDTPPKGLIEKPVAHFQSVRFLNLGMMLQLLNLPVFVSDIDLLLQRGVSDLLEHHAETDIVFNENTGNDNPGSRLTANLLLAHPTENALLMLRFLRAYLLKALGGAEVSRWIDQFGLTMARHHLRNVAKNPQIGYFDTNSDINNVMYRSFEKNPFRFLSLYHGFDTSTLEADDENGSGASAPPLNRKAG